MARSTRMDDESADRITAAADRDPNSPTALSGFDQRAREAAAKNDAAKDPYDYDDYDIE